VVAIIRLYIAWERSWVQYAKTNQINKIKKNYDVEISSILTVYTHIQYQVIVYYLVMNKGPWGGRGAEFLKSGGVVGWNVSFLLSGNVTRWACSLKLESLFCKPYGTYKYWVVMCGDGEWGSMGRRQLLYLHVWGDDFVRCGGRCLWHMVCGVGWVFLCLALAPCFLLYTNGVVR